MKLDVAALGLLIASAASPTMAFVSVATKTATSSHHHKPIPRRNPRFMSEGSPPNNEQGQDDGEAFYYDPQESRTDEEGAALASDFFKMLQIRGIQMEGDEIDFATAEEEELEGQDGEYHPEQGVLDDQDDAILREYDVPEGESLFTDEKLYDDLKDRMFDNAGTFVELNSQGGITVEDDIGVYKPPIVIPDAGLSAGEVVRLVITAIRNNDIPTPDFGIQVFFGYSGQGSQVREQVDEGMTPEQYRKFLMSSQDYIALFEHDTIAIEKAEVMYETNRAYFTVRLIHDDPEKEDVSVNFVLSTTGDGEDDCWLIDSMLIRPSFMRRKRRR
ncbi:hypothetical protein ACHAW6_009642 [Cyclotella cf. meneghiniana]